MHPVTDPWPLVTSQPVAALLLAARLHLRTLGLAHPSPREILEATGAGRSRAYELASEIPALLASLDRPVGRPGAEPCPLPASHDVSALTRETLTFLMDHPGGVHGGRQRRCYSESFRKRVLESREEHPGLDLASFADAVCVPVGTVEDWLRCVAPTLATEDTTTTLESVAAAELVNVKVEAVLAAYQTWHGNFTSFCRHVREHLRLDLGDSLIAGILYEFGERTPKRRSGRTPDEEATRGSFETFFPGAQWVGDGTPITVTVNGIQIGLNFELDVDAHSGAFVGASVREQEDGQAVVDAFRDAVETTDAQPLALLLDNRPSNHTEDVDAALLDTLRIRATTFRPQNKAHVEGAFGLFSRSMPELVIDAQDPIALAKQIARLVITTWARTLNHRPRRDRGGKSRVELYAEGKPTPEQIEEARRSLLERLRKQELARLTQEARIDPIVRSTLDAAFDRLQLIDPERHVRNAIASYPLDAIVDGIAIFEGKRKHGSLPPDVDARYLLGIVRNLHHVHEGEAITEALIHERLALRDRLLLVLENDRQQIVVTAQSNSAALRTIVDKALTTTLTIDRLFWLHAIAEFIREQPPVDHLALFREAARRIHATFSASRADRAKAERHIARALWPID